LISFFEFQNICKKAIRLFEERGREYQVKELRDALKTGDVKELLT